MGKNSVGKGKNRGNEEYIVSGVWDRREEADGSRRYLTSWVGYAEKTWEPIENFTKGAREYVVDLNRILDDPVKHPKPQWLLDFEAQKARGVDVEKKTPGYTGKHVVTPKTAPTNTGKRGRKVDAAKSDVSKKSTVQATATATPRTRGGHASDAAAAPPTTPRRRGRPPRQDKEVKEEEPSPEADTPAPAVQEVAAPPLMRSSPKTRKSLANGVGPSVSFVDLARSATREYEGPNIDPETGILIPIELSEFLVFDWAAHLQKEGGEPAPIDCFWKRPASGFTNQLEDHIDKLLKVPDLDETYYGKWCTVGKVASVEGPFVQVNVLETDESYDEWYMANDAVLQPFINCSHEGEPIVKEPNRRKSTKNYKRMVERAMFENDGTDMRVPEECFEHQIPWANRPIHNNFKVGHKLETYDYRLGGHFYPATVVRVHDKTVDIQPDGFMKTEAKTVPFNDCRLFPCGFAAAIGWKCILPERMEPKKRQKKSAATGDPKEEETEEGWNVERVWERRVEADGTYRYLTSWVGFNRSADTWEPVGSYSADAYEYVQELDRILDDPDNNPKPQWLLDYEAKKAAKMAKKASASPSKTSGKRKADAQKPSVASPQRPQEQAVMHEEQPEDVVAPIAIIPEPIEQPPVLADQLDPMDEEAHLELPSFPSLAVAGDGTAGETSGVTTQPPPLELADEPQPVADEENIEADHAPTSSSMDAASNDDAVGTSGAICQPPPTQPVSVMHAHSAVPAPAAGAANELADESESSAAEATDSPAEEPEQRLPSPMLAADDGQDDTEDMPDERAPTPVVTLSDDEPERAEVAGIEDIVLLDQPGSGAAILDEPKEQDDASVDGNEEAPAPVPIERAPTPVITLNDDDDVRAETEGELRVASPQPVPATPTAPGPPNELPVAHSDTYDMAEADIDPVTGVLMPAENSVYPPFDWKAHMEKGGGEPAPIECFWKRPVGSFTNQFENQIGNLLKVPDFDEVFDNSWCTVGKVTAVHGPWVQIHALSTERCWDEWYMANDPCLSHFINIEDERYPRCKAPNRRNIARNFKRLVERAMFASCGTDKRIPQEYFTRQIPWKNRPFKNLFKVGHKLETYDPLRGEGYFYPATIIEIIGSRDELVRVHFDGFPESQAKTLSFKDYRLFPCGYAAAIGWQCMLPEMKTKQDRRGQRKVWVNDSMDVLSTFAAPSPAQPPVKRKRHSVTRPVYSISSDEDDGRSEKEEPRVPLNQPHRKRAPVIPGLRKRCEASDEVGFLPREKRREDAPPAKRPAMQYSSSMSDSGEESNSSKGPQSAARSGAWMEGPSSSLSASDRPDSARLETMRGGHKDQPAERLARDASCQMIDHREQNYAMSARKDGGLTVRSTILSHGGCQVKIFLNHECDVGPYINASRFRLIESDMEGSLPVVWRELLQQLLNKSLDRRQFLQFLPKFDINTTQHLMHIYCDDGQEAMIDHPILPPSGSAIARSQLLTIMMKANMCPNAITFFTRRECDACKKKKAAAVDARAAHQRLQQVQQAVQKRDQLHGQYQAPGGSPQQQFAQPANGASPSVPFRLPVQQIRVVPDAAAALNALLAANAVGKRPLDAALAPARHALSLASAAAASAAGAGAPQRTAMVTPQPTPDVFPSTSRMGIATDCRDVNSERLRGPGEHVRGLGPAASHLRHLRQEEYHRADSADDERRGNRATAFHPPRLG